MLLIFDSGNTAISYGIYQKDRPDKFGSVKINDIPKLSEFCLKNGSVDEIFIIISSVVPKNTLIIKKIFSNLNPRKIKIAGENFPVKIKSKYRNYNQLGIDRKVNIYGGIQFYKPPFLIIDAGTAITVDYVSKNGTFEGGLIIPGPGIAFQSLMDKTALLPKKRALPKKSTTLLGKTTYEAMDAGIIEGYAAMIDGIISRFKKRYGKTLKVIATGGFSSWLKPYLLLVDRFDPLLAIKTLRLLYLTHLKK